MMQGEVEKNQLKNEVAEEVFNRSVNSKNTLTSENQIGVCKTVFLIFLILILFIFLSFGLFYFHYGPNTRSLLLANHRITKPVIDERRYRFIQLKNGLDVLIIQDEKTTTSAASVSVGVGSLKEGEIYGLAHFLEHMLFLGSVSYPSPKYFDTLLSDNFGGSNAFTEDEKTTYFFEINSRFFTQALEVFSKMFSEPLFDKNRMNKEIQAVNSEHEKNLNNDDWKLNQLLKSISNEYHPFSKFTTGNTKTLAENVNGTVLLNKMIEFYNTYYTPRNMRLTVLSNQSISQMEDTIDKLFGNFRENLPQNKSLLYGKDLSKENPFYKGNTGKIVWYEKIGNTMSLDIYFVVDSLIPKYKTKPSDYFSYMLNYAGKNSLIYHLKRQKLAIKIETGVPVSILKHSQFSISVSLTEKGFQNINSVIQIIFDYINLIKETKISLNIFKELKRIRASLFTFKEKNGYGNYLASLAGLMFDYEYQDLISGDILLEKFNRTEIVNFIDSLNIESSFIVIGSKEKLNRNTLKKFFNGSKSKNETWYGTAFMENKLTDKFMEEVTMINRTRLKQFDLRKKNIYVSNLNSPTKCNRINCFSNNKPIFPNVFYQNQRLKIWHKRDNTFKVPRISSYIEFFVKQLRTTSLDHLIVRLFVNYLDYIMDGVVTDMNYAGNNVDITLGTNGITLNVECYSDVLEKIYKVLLETIFKSKFNSDVFSEILEITHNELLEYETSQPMVKLDNIFNQLVQDNITNIQEEIKLLSNLSFHYFEKRIKEIRYEVFSVAVFYGDVKETQLGFIQNMVAKYLNINNIQSSKSNIENRIDHMNSVRNIQNSFIYRIKNSFDKEINHLVANYYQVGYRSIKNSILSYLLDLTWGSNFYYELRTVRQLGYIVRSGLRRINNILYMSVLVQGSKMTPDKMNLEIDQVLMKLKENLFNLSENDLENLKISLISDILKPNDNLSDRYSEVSSEISSNSLSFNRKELLIQELRKTSIQDLKSFFSEIFINNPKKLSIQMFAGNYKQTIPMKKESYLLNKHIKLSVTNSNKVLRGNKFIPKALNLTRNKQINKLK